MIVPVPLLTHAGLRWIPRAVLALHWLFVGAALRGGRVPAGVSGGASGPVGDAAWVLPVVSLGVLILLQGLGGILPRRPELFNFPTRERFLRLPRKHQEPGIAIMRSTLDLVAVESSLMLFFAQVAEWRSALGYEPIGEHLVLVFLATAIMPWVFVMLGRLERAVQQAEAAWQREDSDA